MAHDQFCGAACQGGKLPCPSPRPAGDGYVVVGSDDGKVRLYSERTLTQAKTAIPGLGLPITNVDVTYDGEWVEWLGWQAGRRGALPLLQLKGASWMLTAPCVPARSPCHLSCHPFTPKTSLLRAGKWVLATTKSYLMVMKTTYRDPKSGKEQCGFVSRMGANAPAPRLLRLKTEDVRLTVRPKGRPVGDGKAMRGWGHVLSSDFKKRRYGQRLGCVLMR